MERGEFNALFIHNAAYAERRRGALVLGASHIWTSSNDVPNLDSAFASHNNLLGTRIAVSALPWPPFTFAKRVSTDSAHAYGNFWGVQVSLHPC